MNQSTNIHPDADTEIAVFRNGKASWLSIGRPAHGVSIFTPGEDDDEQAEFCQTLIDRLTQLRDAIIKDQPLNTRLDGVINALS